MNAPKLHPTGLHPESLAARVLDFMTEQRLGLPALAAAADLVAADCRFNFWVGSEVKNSGLAKEGWLKLLDDGEKLSNKQKPPCRIMPITETQMTSVQLSPTLLAD